MRYRTASSPPVLPTQRQADPSTQAIDHEPQPRSLRHLSSYGGRINRGKQITMTSIMVMTTVMRVMKARRREGEEGKEDGVQQQEEGHDEKQEVT